MSPAGIVVLTIIGCVILMDIIVLNIILFDTKDEKEHEKACAQYKNAFANYQRTYYLDGYSFRDHINGRLKTLEDFVDEDRKDIEGIDEQIDEIEDEIKRLGNFVDEHGEDLGGHDNRIDELEAMTRKTLNDINDELLNYRVRLDDMSIRLRYLEGKDNQVEAEDD